MAAGLRAGVAFVELVPRVAPGFEAAVAKDVDGSLARVGSKVSSTGATLSKTVTLPLVAAFAAAGVGIVAAGNKVDEALDTIAIKSGATGAALDGLESSFRNVAGKVPDDFNKVAEAIGMVHQRTGATGPALEGLTTQILTLSRITGEDLATTIENSTRLFGDWGIAADDQGAALDRLFKVSQVTGTGVNDLSQLLVTFGGPLRQLGFSMDEAAVMIGKFQREGVNTELVLGSMRTSLGRMAKAGEEPIETFRRVTDEIKNAGSAGEANAIALELFGARAGPDMAAAIREGRFELGEMMAASGNFEGSISKTAKATDGWAETWGKFRNKLILAVEPIATKLFAALDQFLPKLEPVLDWIGRAIDAFTNLDPKWQLLIAGIVAAVAAAGPLLSILGAVIPVLAAIAGAISLPVVAIAALVAALVVAYQKSEEFRAIVDSVVQWLVANVPPLIQAVADTVLATVTDLVAWWRDHWEEIREATEHVLNAVTGIVNGAIAVISAAWGVFGDELLNLARIAWEQISLVIETAVRLVRDVIDLVLALINGDWDEAWQAILDIVSAVWELIKGTIGNALEYVGQVVEVALSALRVLWDLAWEAIRAALEGAWNAMLSLVEGILESIRSTIEGALEAVGSLIDGALDGIRSAWDAAWNGIKDLLGAVWDGIRSAVDAAVDGVKSKIEGTLSAISSTWSSTWGAIRDFVSGVWGAIKGFISGGIDDVVGYVQGIPGRIRSAVSGAFDALADAFRGAVNTIIRGWNGLEFRIPSFSVGPVEFGGFTLGMPNLPTLASGGTFSGLALVGELGPELAFSASKTRVTATKDLAGMLEHALRAVDLTPSPATATGSPGPALVIEHADFHDDADLDLLMAKASFAAKAGRFD